LEIFLVDSSALQESAQTPSDDDSDIAYVNVPIRSSKQTPDFFPLSKGRATRDDGLEEHRGFQSRRSTVCLYM
jgi:hypothetical protein